MRHLNFIILAFFALMLTACATGPKIDYAGISSNIQAGEKGGVIGGFKASGMSYASLTLENVDTGSPARMSLLSSPRVFSLNPGTYKIKTGKIGGYNVTGNMPLIGLWAEPFEVKAGEVTNLGVLQMKRITNNVKTSGGSKVLNALSSFGTNMNDDVTHVSFNTLPMSDSAQVKAIEKFVGLESSDIVDRHLKMRISETEFRGLIAKASAKDEEGKLPTRQEIRTKLAGSLLMLMLKSGELPDL